MNRDAGSTYKKENYARKNNKQIMEKRRRARINSCLAELKGLVLKGLQKEESDFAKLEKADILEMTVTYLKNNRNQQNTSSLQTDSDIVRYRAGFNECAKYAYSYIGGSVQVQNDTKLQLMEHLADVLYTKKDSPQKTYSNEVKLSSSCAIKREISSPSLEHTQFPPYMISNSQPVPTCFDYGRTSPQAAETFPVSMGFVDIQSLSLKDIQAVTPPVTGYHQTQSDIANQTNPLPDLEPSTGVTTQPSPVSSDSMWRPW